MLNGKTVAILVAEGLEQAEMVGQEVVVDNGIVSRRKPADIPAFSRRLVEDIGEGMHRRGAEVMR